MDSDPQPLPASAVAPGLFSLAQDGRGQGAILHANTAEYAAPSRPAVAGEALEIYLTGLSGLPASPRPEVTIGGVPAEVLFFGDAPGFVGLDQVNVRVPAGVAPGPAVPVRLTYAGVVGNEVTIAVR